MPDELFDELAPDLSEAELRVLLYIVRRTLGFKRRSDRISLGQMTDGITKKDGRVLDRGTGMSRRGVVKGCQGLVAKEIILVEKQKASSGDNDVNVYQLRFREASRDGVVTVGTHGGERDSLPVGNSGAPQETEKQETEEQHHDGALLRELIEFGVTTAAATRIVANFSGARIRAKLDLVRWLVDTKSMTVARNPAGYLRRAIEDDYAPPPSYRSPADRQAAADRRERLAASVSAIVTRRERKQHHARAARRRDVLRAYPPERIEGTHLTTETAWRQVAEEIRGELSPAAFSTLIGDTILASCGARGAVIVVPSTIIAGLLRRRAHSLISAALERIVGRTISVEYHVWANPVREQPPLLVDEARSTTPLPIKAA